jgi:ABC-type proline/glycine betaine transport system ATPase subunit
MFIITHDLEAALICDKTAILREGRMLEFDSPYNLIKSLPSNGLVARFEINDLNEAKITRISEFPSVKKVLRVGNEVIEILMDSFEENLPRLIQYMIERGVTINSMSRDLASFRRFFQIRIQEEEEREKLHSNKGEL